MAELHEQLKTNLSPLYDENVVCPICAYQHKQEAIRPGAFYVEKTEYDMHVIVYKWRSETHNYINPLYYFFYTCPRCGFTETPKRFKDTSSKYADINAFRKAYVSLSTQKNPTLLLIRQAFKNYQISFERAMLQHLLAIYTMEHENVKDFTECHGELGRYYLRTAWLFREADRPVVQTKNNALLESFKHDFIKYTDALSHFRTFSDKFQSTVTERFNIIDAQEMNELQVFRDGFNDFKINTNTCFENFEKINRQIDNNRRQFYKLKSTDTSGESDPFTQLLNKVQEQWAETPLNEPDCIIKSNLNYKEALNHGYAGENQKKRFQLFQIMAYGYFRIKSYEELSEHTQKVFKYMDEKQKDIVRSIEAGKKRFASVNKKINELMHAAPELQKRNEFEQEQLHIEKEHIKEVIDKSKSDLLLIKDYVNNFKIIRKKAQQGLVQSELERAIDIIMKKSFTNEKEIIRELESQNIRGSIINNFFDPGQPEASGKKGFFDFLR